MDVNGIEHILISAIKIIVFGVMPLTLAYVCFDFIANIRRFEPPSKREWLAKGRSEQDWEAYKGLLQIERRIYTRDFYIKALAAFVAIIVGILFWISI
ncbi:hypothetical protein [Arcanobacterium bovis]|uniref:Uncharacterized protein n=1 Tax=Arcanobacterium bovis TaxID=2529275 RepID=A0A4Q9UYK4_9ACTO|nr:hypothetical protein [Arcanobacterium bovis]TBW20734.1 hypothetical protein EZJ44_08420 [Arcanobacterium bovis]